ncbi:MAG: hypothetical protein ACE5JH_08400 [Acidobacteriota bacterium]
MCGAAAEAGDVGRGLNISILFLLGAVFMAVAAIVTLAVRAHLQQVREASRLGPAAGAAPRRDPD